MLEVGLGVSRSTDVHEFQHASTRRETRQLQCLEDSTVQKDRLCNQTLKPLYVLKAGVPTVLLQSDYGGNGTNTFLDSIEEQ